MYLYEKDNNYIKIYELKEDEKKIAKFRREELANIPKEEQVLYAKAKVRDKDDLVFDKYIRDNSNNRPLIATYADNSMGKDFWEYRTYHKLLNQNNSNNTEILFNYFNGMYNNRNAVVIHYLDLTRKYLLLTQKHYSFFGATDGISNYCMFNLINLPVSLYILQMIEKGRFKDIQDMDIDKVISLFKFSYLYYINTDMFNEKALASVNNKIERDSYILKRIK